jgi:hypothetical protein
MKTAFVVEAKFIDNQTIHINEPLNIDCSDIIVTIQPANKYEKRKRVFGCAKGTIEIKEGFYEPTEDFKEYIK